MIESVIGSGSGFFLVVFFPQLGFALGLHYGEQALAFFLSDRPSRLLLCLVKFVASQRLLVFERRRARLVLIGVMPSFVLFVVRVVTVVVVVVVALILLILSVVMLGACRPSAPPLAVLVLNLTTMVIIRSSLFSLFLFRRSSAKIRHQSFGLKRP